MSQETKILIGVGVVSLAVLGGGAALLNKTSSGSVISASDQSKVLGTSAHQIGENNKVTLVEFGDFQCPACGAVNPTISKIIQDYSGKINFAFRNFPLPMHQNALVAAEAAEAAAEQGKYWEMHEKLYGNQNSWSESKDPITIFVSYAKDLGLDTTKFKQEVEANKFSDKIQQDSSDGTSLGVSATPTFFLNNEKFSGVLSYDEFKAKIDTALKY